MIKQFRWWLFRMLIGPVVAICPQPKQSYFRHILGIGVAGFRAEINYKKSD